MHPRIIVEYSAIAAKSENAPPVFSLQRAVIFLKKHKINGVADVGCGLLVNLPYLLKMFPNVYAIDTALQYERIIDRLSSIKKRYKSFARFFTIEEFSKANLKLDAVFMVNVLHVIPVKKDRERLLLNCWNNLKKGGHIFVDVPTVETYYRDKLTPEKKFRDGYLMKRPGNIATFYKQFINKEIEACLKIANFKNPVNLHCHHRASYIATK